MKRVIRRLNRDSFDQPFYYDRPKEKRGSFLYRAKVGIASLEHQK